MSYENGQDYEEKDGKWSNKPI